MKKINQCILSFLILTVYGLNFVLATDKTKNDYKNGMTYKFVPQLELPMEMGSMQTLIVMGQTNYINGNPQLNPNSFGVSGTGPGFAAGIYYYTLTRSGSFSTDNFKFKVDAALWLPGVLTNNGTYSNGMFIESGGHTYSISGTIPHGSECGVYETIIIKIYASVTHQLVQTTTFKIGNALNPTPVSNFKILGSSAEMPSIINACQSLSKNILLNNLKLTYTGSGSVSKYRISIMECNSTGQGVAGGFNYIQGWVNGAVPLTINLNTSLTGSGGTVPSYWAYYLVTLETFGGGLCNSGSTFHRALLHLTPGPCSK